MWINFLGCLPMVAKEWQMAFLMVNCGNPKAKTRSGQCITAFSHLSKVFTKVGITQNAGELYSNRTGDSL
jgi:hypothetical protein